MIICEWPIDLLSYKRNQTKDNWQPKCHHGTLSYNLSTWDPRENLRKNPYVKIMLLLLSFKTSFRCNISWHIGNIWHPYLNVNIGIREVNLTSIWRPQFTCEKSMTRSERLIFSTTCWHYFFVTIFFLFELCGPSQ